MIRRIWAYVTDEVFANFLARARMEKCFTDSHGNVDIGALLAKLVETYGDGVYVINVKKAKAKEHSERFTYPPAMDNTNPITTESTFDKAVVVSNIAPEPEPEPKKEEKPKRKKTVKKTEASL